MKTRSRAVRAELIAHLESQRRRAHDRLAENRYEIKKLSEEQHELKKAVADLSRLLERVKAK